MRSLKQTLLWLSVCLILYASSSQAEGDAMDVLAPDTQDFSERDLNEMTKCIEKQKSQPFKPPVDSCNMPTEHTTFQRGPFVHLNSSSTRSPKEQPRLDQFDALSPLHQIASPSYILLFGIVFSGLYFFSPLPSASTEESSHADGQHKSRRQRSARNPLIYYR